MAFVYLIKEESNDSSKYKIGMTSEKDANKRLKKLQTGNPNKLSFECLFETKFPYKLEMIMHNYYEGKNIINEWYELENEDIEKFLPLCEMANENIKKLQENHFFNKKSRLML